MVPKQGDPKKDGAVGWYSFLGFGEHQKGEPLSGSKRETKQRPVADTLCLGFGEHQNKREKKRLDGAPFWVSGNKKERPFLVPKGKPNKGLLLVAFVWASGNTKTQERKNAGWYLPIH